MNLYKLNRVLHRDLGYFFIGMTIIYAVSGIAINHLRDWNPNYIIKKNEFSTSLSVSHNDVSKQQIDELINQSGDDGRYKSHYFQNPTTLVVFIDGGNIRLDLPTGEARLETIKRRPVFFEMNRLHYNPGVLWMWFSDAFCVALIFLAISGLFIIKGKNGLKWRGAMLGAIGIIIPLLFILFYL